MPCAAPDPQDGRPRRSFAACRVALLLAFGTSLPHAVPSAADQPVRPALLWRYNAGSAVVAPPACDGNRIAFPTRAGAVVLLDTNGTLLSSFPVREGSNAPAVFSAAPVMALGRVVVASRRGRISALETNGLAAWQYECGEEVQASPVLSPDSAAPRLFVLTQASGIVHCLDARTGRRIWMSAKTDRCDGAPALTGKHIVFGNCEAALHVLDAATGHAAARIGLCTECQVAAGVATDGPLVYTGTFSGTVYCCDIRRQAVVWTNSASRAETFSSPALAGNLLVIGSYDASLYAIHRSDGTPAWSFQCSGTPGDPVIRGDRVFFGDRGTLRALSLASGKELWSVAVSDEIWTPVVTDSLILVGADDGSLSAYRIPAPMDAAQETR